MTGGEAAFEFREVTKTFGSVVANDGVSFSVRRKALHGVVGENGAGKSTIMKILYGMYEPSAGHLFVEGKAVRIANPQAALKLGIGMVHQHFMLVPTLSVWQNVILGTEDFFIRKKESIAKLESLCKEFGFTLDVRAPIERLTVGQQQQVELLKLLYRDSRILILDEPTAVLTPQETEALFKRLRALRDNGRTIVLITHKLKEILGFTETVTVMRRGKVVETVETSTLTEETLAEAIIGRARKPLADVRPPPRERVRLSAEHLTLGNALCDLSFQIREGEIVGIAGVEGNGQQELVETVAAARGDYAGKLVFEGRSMGDCDTYRLKQEGLAVIPPDRHKEAGVLDMCLTENFILGHHREPAVASRWALSPSRIRKSCSVAMDRFDVRPPNPDLQLGQLSGGNQQKLVLARELERETRLLVAAHPTRGVDVGAIEFIHGEILRRKASGAAVLLVSSELDELLALSDRILVLYQGRIQGEQKRGAFNECTLGRWMTGGTA